MRKIFLTAIAVLSIASAQVFGMYGVDTDWINFLTHGNQFRARLDQLGFTLGNDTIRGTFGFDNDATYGGVYGSIFNTGNDANGVKSDVHYDFIPTISMGLGYTSSLIGVGVGYNVTIAQGKTEKYNGKSEAKTTERVGHTPVLVLNALDNALRIAVPIQVYVNNDKKPNDVENKLTAVSLDSQIRYYTGLEVLPEIRLYLRYGNYTEDKSSGNTTKYKAESFGFDFRLYFGAMVEEVALKPFIRIVYNTALGKNHAHTRIQAIELMNKEGNSTYMGKFRGGSTPDFDKTFYNLNIMPALGLTANSDIVSLYLEPSLGLKVEGGGAKSDKDQISLGYGVYSEIYITPLKNLEWYFEASIGNVESSGTGTVNILGTGGTGSTTTEITVAGKSKNMLNFAATTGITWYLPQF